MFCPKQASGNFTPNAGLEVTPGFLDEVIQLVKSKGYGLVSLEEAAEELAGTLQARRPLQCLHLMTVISTTTIMPGLYSGLTRVLSRFSLRPT
jgi:peptidoglycan/xylan/chitin deacetylase (PgdA/CDA1 family)